MLALQNQTMPEGGAAVFLVRCDAEAVYPQIKAENFKPSGNPWAIPYP